MVSIGLGVICKAAQYRPDLLTQVGAEELARTGELWKGSEWRKVARRKVPAERPGWQFQRDWKPAFIEALRMTGNVTHAAQYAGRIEIGRPSLMPAASASCDARSLASSTAPLRAAPSGPRSSRGNCPLQTRRLLTWRYTVGRRGTTTRGQGSQARCPVLACSCATRPEASLPHSLHSRRQDGPHGPVLGERPSACVHILR